MKKITLLFSLLITGISFGQLQQIKTAPDTELLCASGGFGEIQYPSTEYTGGKEGKYSGASGTADWTYTTTLTATNTVYQKSEIIFLNLIPENTAVSDILSIVSVSGGGLTTADYSLKIVAPATTTGNDPDLAAICAVEGKKIRYSLIKSSDYIAGGEEVTITLLITDKSNDFTRNFILKITPPAALSTKNLENFNFKFAPNPAKDFINLTANSNIENVEIISLLGKTVISKNLNSTNETIDISNITNGIYLMNVTVDGSKGTYKIIKE